MDYATQTRIHETVIATLRHLGVENPRLDPAKMRILTRDGFYAGHVVQSERIRVFFSEDGQIIDFFGPDGVLLKKLGVEQKAAA